MCRIRRAVTALAAGVVVVSLAVAVGAARAEGPAYVMKLGTATINESQHEWCKRFVAMVEKDAGGQKDLSDARVQANVRQQIFNRKDQTLKNAFSEASRNKATVVNYLAQRILDNAGKTQ